jgi:hypothetical protein
MGVFGFLDSVGARPFVPDEVESEVTEVRDDQRGIAAEGSGTAR